MSIQLLIVIAIVGFAAWHVGRHLFASAKNMLKSDGDGCATGCGNCAFAPDTTATENLGTKKPFVSLGDLNIPVSGN